MEFQLFLCSLCWYSAFYVTFCTIQIIISIKPQKLIQPLIILFLTLGSLCINLNQKEVTFFDSEHEESDAVGVSKDGDGEYHYFDFAADDDEPLNHFFVQSSFHFDWLKSLINPDFSHSTYISSLVTQKRYLLFRALKIDC